MVHMTHLSRIPDAGDVRHDVHTTYTAVSGVPPYDYIVDMVVKANFAASHHLVLTGDCVLPLVNPFI